MIIDNQKILNEISEMFGKFRRNDGTLVSFKQNAIEINNNNPLTEEPRPNKNVYIPFFSGILVSKYTNKGSRKYYGWQKEIINELENGNDVYVVAPPGGGKTTPLMGYWIINQFMGNNAEKFNADIHNFHFDQLIKENGSDKFISLWSNIFSSILISKRIDNSDVAKVLFVTPIRVLAFEQANEFQDNFYDLFLLLKSLFNIYVREYINQNIPERQRNNIDQNILNDFINNNINSQNNTLKIIAKTFQFLIRVNSQEAVDLFKKFLGSNDNFEPWLNQKVKDMICVQTGGGPGPYNSVPEKAIVIIATYGSAKNFIHKINNEVKFIVYDEAHVNTLLK